MFEKIKLYWQIMKNAFNPYSYFVSAKKFSIYMQYSGTEIENHTEELKEQSAHLSNFLGYSQKKIIKLRQEIIALKSKNTKLVNEVKELKKLFLEMKDYLKEVKNER